MSEEMERNLRNQEKYLAGLYDGKIEGKEEGKIEGKKEGKIEGKLETQTLIVKNLLNNSISDDIILKTTNISKEELEEIKKELE